MLLLGEEGEVEESLLELAGPLTDLGPLSAILVTVTECYSDTLSLGVTVTHCHCPAHCPTATPSYHHISVRRMYMRGARGNQM